MTRPSRRPARCRRGTVAAVLALLIPVAACGRSEPGADPPASTTTVASTSTTSTEDVGDDDDVTGTEPSTDEPDDTPADEQPDDGDERSPTSTGSPGCRREPVPDGGTVDTTLTSGGEERGYVLRIPPGHDGTEPLPVVIALHSLSIDHRTVPDLYRLTETPATSDAIIVSPSGRSGGPDGPYWNAVALEQNADVTFITELLDHVEATRCVDTANVHVIGFSNGAQMASLLACRIGGRLAGITVVAGVEHNEPCAGPPVAVTAHHGSADRAIPYAGGGLDSTAITARNGGPTGGDTDRSTGVDDAMARWAARNGCDGTFVDEQITASVRRRTWQRCAEPVVLHAIEGGGHAWPGIDDPERSGFIGRGTTEIDATAMFAEGLPAD